VCMYVDGLGMMFMMMMIISACVCYVEDGRCMYM
jgi:hypothetical protein